MNDALQQLLDRLTALLAEKPVIGRGTQPLCASCSRCWR